MPAGHGWARRVGAVLAPVVIVLAGTLVPAAAAPDRSSVPDRVDGVPFERWIQHNDHTMGSQIRRVEGDTSTRQSEMAAMRPQGIDVTGNKATDNVPGLDVSSHQGDVDWQHWWDSGQRFAYVKATEGTYYTSPQHAGQYNGAYDVGMIRGSYHFAIPNDSSGAAQANYFVEHGGGWSADGRTLPGALDLEYNPYGDTCYGMSKEALAGWINDFNATYLDRTGRYPVIYTSTSWWNQCVGADFSPTNPLWVARYADSVGELPHNWPFHTIWQYTSSPLDQNLFNGNMDRLRALATG